MNQIQSAQQQAVMASLAGIPGNVRGMIAQAAIASQRKVMALPYYSTARYQLPAAASNVFTLTPPQPDRTLFTYKIGDKLGTAQGWDASTTDGNATDAETNLTKASETRNNDDVFIWGLAGMWTPESDAQIIQLASRVTTLKLGFNAEDSYTVGRLDFIPGGGGLYGTGIAYMQIPDLGSTWNTRWGQLTNGTPGRDNYYRLPQPLVWRGNGTGADTAFSATLLQRRNIVINSAADRAGAAGVSAWTKPSPPDAVGTKADFTLRLVCASVGKRSQNA